MPGMPRPAAILTLLTTLVASAADPLPPAKEDWTSLHWAEGLPAAAGGLRVFETGRFALAMDSVTLATPHFGILAAGLGYEAASSPANQRWRALPPASLSLLLRTGGRTFRATSAAPWDGQTGPRIVESGRWFQRADLCGLIFTDGSGRRLDGNFRLETNVWPDRLGFALRAQPPLEGFGAGTHCFGRVGGGLGLDGESAFDGGTAAVFDAPQFSCGLWVYLPGAEESSGSKMCWLACRGANENDPGNFGFTIHTGLVDARLCTGPLPADRHVLPAAKAHRLPTEAWSHLALTYDGTMLRLFVNGREAAAKEIGRTRPPGRGRLFLGRRGDRLGPGFRGAIDEVRIHGRALSPAEVLADFRNPGKATAAEFSLGFDDKVESRSTRRRERWSDLEAEIAFTPATGPGWRIKASPAADAASWHQAQLSFRPTDGTAEPTPVVSAEDKDHGAPLTVSFDAANGWHHVDLDPVRGQGDGNDVLERTRVRLSNPSDRPTTARLMFGKTGAGLRHFHGQAITGVTAVLRLPDGTPSGIPVQLSKNWHARPEPGDYSGAWFHGLVSLSLPPRADLELELAMAYGHWGRLPAVTHSQLCLIGWGSNQLWDQAAFGAWGESFCFEPDQAQGQCMVLDVRPLMVTSVDNRQWGWTNNVGGGDWFRLFGADGQRIRPTGMRTAYLSQGPCLTHVAYSGRLGTGLTHRADVSLARSADIAKATYRLRLDVTERTEFSRLVFFQVGADTYSYSRDAGLAVGDARGLVRAWEATPGDDVDRGMPIELSGPTPWASLHRAKRPADSSPGGAWADRGYVIRSWQARLGGRDARPWIVEHGARARSAARSSLDLVPPPGVHALEPGDFVEAVVEHVILPQSAADYYGPDENLRAALARDAGTWKLVLREAAEGARQAEVSVGRLRALHPAVEVDCSADRAELTLSGGTGHVPVTFRGLASAGPWQLAVDGSTAGNEVWQADFQPSEATWSVTFNLPSSRANRRLVLSPAR